MDDRRPEWLRSGPDLVAEIRRYGAAALVVVAVGGGALAWIGRTPAGEAASESDEAIIVDLPPAITSALPRSETEDAPAQEASVAAPPTPPAETAKPETRPDPLPPVEPDQRAEIPAQPEPQKPEPQKPDQVAPPPVAAAAAQVATAPAGAADPTAPAEPTESPAARRHAAAALSKWQRALLGRLETAKRDVHASGLHGRVDIAFSVDHRGRLLAHHIAHSSGSERLDRLALGLVERAAPFPEPPAAAGDALSFTVPIVFSRRGL